MNEYLNRIFCLFSEKENYKEHLIYFESENLFFRLGRDLFFSFCISISFYYLSEIFDSGFISKIFFQSIIFYFFLRFLGMVFMSIFDWSIKKEYRINSLSLILSAMSDLQILFIIFVPLSILTSSIYISKFSRFILTLTPILIIYIYYFLYFAKEVYEIPKWKLFLKTLSKLFLLIQIPFIIFFVLFYFVGSFV